jgi:acyl-CoA thioester hydrolase
MTPFSWQARVYWEDTDAGGVVYYANYLRYIERARGEWLRQHGLSQRALAADPGVLFAVVTLEAHYRRPARLDDLLAISCVPAREGASGIRFEQQIWVEGQPDEILFDARVHAVCLGASSFKPRRLPQQVSKVLP